MDTSFKSLTFGEDTFTVSAVCDRIRDYMQTHDEYGKIVYSYLSNPNGIFLFNPLESKMINEFFMQDPENFPILVKRAILDQLKEYTSHADHRLIEKATLGISVLITDARQIKMGDWYAEYEGMPVNVECQVVGANQEETYIKSATARCWKCDFKTVIGEKDKLSYCGNTRCERYDKVMEIDNTTIKTGDTKIILIQEPLDEVRHGTSRILSCIIKDEAVRNTFIGQHKKLIGVFRSHTQENKTTNKIMIHAISVQDIESNKTKLPTEKQIAKFKKLVATDEYLDILTKSFASEIYGEKLAKLCVILARVGGTRVGRLRGETHCLLIGNAGTGKSKILEFLLEVTPNCGFAVGGTMTGTGITISMDTLPNKQKILRVGIVGRCNGSVVAIDEFNQTSDEDKGKLFECMESGKMHYNKGGFDQVADAETTIISAANPKDYVYDFTRTISDNVNLPAPLTDRFDLKVNLTDDKTELEEQNKLNHIIYLRNNGLEKYIEKEKLLNTSDIFLLLNYAKSLKPVMSEKASNLMNNFYMNMKSLEKKQRDGSFKINTRFYESVIRVSTAYAKLMLSETVTEDHAMLTIEIIKQTLRTFGMDTEKDGVVMPLQHTDDSAEGAFRKHWREQEGVFQSSWIPEKDLLESLVNKYSTKFKVFSTVARASKYFDKLYNDGIITKEAGLYKLL